MWFSCGLHWIYMSESRFFYMSFTCTIHTCDLHVFYMLFTCRLHASYMAYLIHDIHMWFTCGLHVDYISFRCRNNAFVYMLFTCHK